MTTQTIAGVPGFPTSWKAASLDVNVKDLHPQMMRFLSTAAAVHAWLFEKPLVVTSGNDGAHVTASKHYKNKALDLRAVDKTLEEQLVFTNVIVFLGERLGVALFDERAKPGEPHYHVELAV